MYKIEKIGKCLGYDYLVKFLDGGWRCGYVRLHTPEELAHEDYTINENGLDVHNGITFDKGIKDDREGFPNGRWIGFTCIGSGDKSCVEDAEKAFGFPHTEGLHLIPNTGHYWTQDEVEAECKYLCNQLNNKNEEKTE